MLSLQTIFIHFGEAAVFRDQFPLHHHWVSGVLTFSPSFDIVSCFVDELVLRENVPDFVCILVSTYNYILIELIAV